MKEISLQNVMDKRQHRSILIELERYYNGLKLQELTYLLSKYKLQHNYSKLQEKFGNERKDIFLSRKRISVCLSDLKDLGLVIKIGKKYVLRTKSLELSSLFDNIKILEHHKKLVMDMLEIYDKFFNDPLKNRNIIPNIETFLTDDIQVYFYFSHKTMSDEYRNKVNIVTQELLKSLKKLDELYLEYEEKLMDDEIKSISKLSHEDNEQLKRINKKTIEFIKKIYGFSKENRNITIVMNSNKKNMLKLISEWNP